MWKAVALTNADVSNNFNRGSKNKNIFGLEITVGMEMKSTSTKKIFLRGMHFHKNVNSICDWTLSGLQCCKSLC